MTLYAEPLTHSLSHGLAVKICGLMQPRHALAAAENGAGMLGMVFAPSRRKVSIEAACAIHDALERLPERPRLVGVFVNETTQQMLEIADTVGLDVLQLSGDESAEQVAECAEEYPVIKAVRFPSSMPVEQVLDSVGEYGAFSVTGRVRLLLDTYRVGEYGGTGEKADWLLAASIAEQLPLILAGGLNPSNVGEAIGQVSPWGVDVSSGVEREGSKDSALIREFLSAAHSASVLKG